MGVIKITFVNGDVNFDKLACSRRVLLKPVSNNS